MKYFNEKKITRREFLKVLGVASLSLLIVNPLFAAKKRMMKTAIARKLRKYPGRVQGWNSNYIKQRGKWLG